MNRAEGPIGLRNGDGYNIGTVCDYCGCRSMPVIQALGDEHDELVALLGDLAHHIQREEYDVFPASVLAVAPSAWDDVEAAADAARRRGG